MSATSLAHIVLDWPDSVIWEESPDGMGMVLAPGVYMGVPFEQHYLGLPGLSKSRAKALRDTPAHYQASWARTYGPAVSIGKAADMGIYDGPAALADAFVTPPLCTGAARWTTTKAGKAWAAEQAAHGRAVLSHADAAKVLGIVGAVWEHPLASALLRAGIGQASLFWNCPETGVRCKGRPDTLIPPGARLRDHDSLLLPWWDDLGVVVDLKTVARLGGADPAKFAWSALDFAYHWDAGFYLNAMEALTGQEWPHFVLIVAEQEPPHRVEVLRLADRAVDLGRSEVLDAIELFAACSESGHWDNSTTSTETAELDLPARAYYTY